MRKRKGRLSAKASRGTARGTILNYLAPLPPAELASLTELVLKPVFFEMRPGSGESQALVAHLQAWVGHGAELSVPAAGLSQHVQRHDLPSRLQFGTIRAPALAPGSHVP